MTKIYLGPAGTGGSSERGFIDVKKKGLDAVEIEFTYSVWMKASDARKIAELNKKLKELNEKVKELKAELLKSPNIENIAVSSNNLTTWGNTGPIEWETKNPDELIEIGYNWVDYDFLKTFDLDFFENFLKF